MQKSLFLSGILLACSIPLQAQEFSMQQQQAWTALEEQIALAQNGDWEEHSKYIHPDVSFWGPDTPVPIGQNAKGLDLWQIELDQSGKAIGHNLTPISVLVRDDVAIINFYLEALREASDGSVVRTALRGHNTWKKDDNRWRLLATYNTFD